LGGKLPISKIQLTTTHGKTTTISMILQVFCKCKLNGNNDKKKDNKNYKIAIELLPIYKPLVASYLKLNLLLAIDFF
jgi:hypothetical protein